MKHRFQITVVGPGNLVVHNGIVTVEDPDQLAAHLRKVANTIADLDFESLTKVSPAITNSASSA